MTARLSAVFTRPPAWSPDTRRQSTARRDLFALFLAHRITYDEAREALASADPHAAYEKLTTPPPPPQTLQQRWRAYVAGLDPDSPVGRRYGPMHDIPNWFE
jgi:hypothetical protein